MERESQIRGAAPGMRVTALASHVGLGAGLGERAPG